MAENKKEFTMEDVVVKRKRKGDYIEGTIFQVDDNVIYVTLEDNSEARMYANHYGKQIDSFVGEVKVGDKIDAIVSDVKDTDEASYVLLDRNRMVKDENFKILQDIYREETVVESVVTKVGEKGLHLKIHGFSVFLPFGLLDKELINRKDELKGEKLDVNIIEVKPGRRPRIIASRKKIFEVERLQVQEERARLRKEEFESIKTGDVLTGRVELIEKHMALIRFENVAGRLRISQIANRRIDKIEDVLTVGEDVTVKVIKKDHSLDLSMKALLPTPHEEYEQNHKKGDQVTGRVVQKLPFGIVIELAESVRGLLHNSEYSWNPDENFQDYVKIEDEIETVITHIDAKKRKISLSRRLLLDNPWKNVSFDRGEIVECKVVEVNENGIVVEAKGVQGFIPNRELAVERVDDAEKLFAVEDVVKAAVTDVNPKRWHLQLSIKRIKQMEEREGYEQYLTDDIEKTTLGDLFEEDLKEVVVEEEKKKK